MEPMPVILDISSDEEPDLGEGPDSFNYDWVKELLDQTDTESDDSDEVIVVREVKPKLKAKSSRSTVKDVDDDCVVLDGDPENRVTSLNEAATGSDELLIVGEKGQIACRDYPHPRHLCAKFPFSSTPHERHCDQCHCYVCDSLAPCLKWCTGMPSTDHCHATDKAETWKMQRKNFKMGMSAPLPASTNYDTSPCMAHPQGNQVLPLDIIRLSENSVLRILASGSSANHTCSSLNPTQKSQASRPTAICACSSSLDSTIQNEVLRPNAIPACSSATIFTVPNGTNHGRFQESGSTLARNRCQPPSFPRQLLGVRNNVIRRDRRNDAFTVGPQSYRSHMMSKGIGNVATQTVNHSAHGSPGRSNHNNPAEQNDRYHATAVLSNDRNQNGRNDIWLTTNLSSYPHSSSAQTSLNCVSGNAVTSKTQAFSLPLSQSYVSQNIDQSCNQGNEVPSNVACLNSNQYENEHQIGSYNENASGNIIQCGNPSQDTCQLQPNESNQIETARTEDFSVFVASWTNNTSTSIEPLIESSHVQSSGFINEPPGIKESGVQFAGSTNLSALDDIESWFFDTDSVPVAVDAAFPSELNIPSPDLGPIDTGLLLFDNENSWNGLAQA